MADLRGLAHDLTKCVDCGADRDKPNDGNASSRARCADCRTAMWRVKSRARWLSGHPTSQPRVGWMKRSLGPTRRPSMKDIAWAAGIYEGEGSVYLAGRSTRVQVYQKERWLLDRLREMFGGSVQARRGSRSPAGSPWVSAWVLSGPRSRGFLMTIYSFLSPRRQAQVQAALGGGPHR